MPGPDTIYFLFIFIRIQNGSIRKVKQWKSKKKYVFENIPYYRVVTAGFKTSLVVEGPTCEQISGK